MNILSYVDLKKLWNFIKYFPELNQIFVRKRIFFPLLSSSRAIKWRKKYLNELESFVGKLIQERNMTSKLIKFISGETRFIIKEIKWEGRVLIYPKDNINRWEKISFPCVKIHMKDIVSIYWVLLHYYITCILSLKYITWRITKTRGIYITVCSYK